MEANMKAFLLLVTALVVSACAPTPAKNMDIVMVTAPGYPILEARGVHFAPCKESNEIGLCTRWVHQSELCVNPKGPYADPPLLSCPKDKDGKPIPFK